MEIRSYDVIVVGSGAAGVTAAATAARAGARVALLCKDPVGCGNTRISLGGFAGIGVSAGDSPQEFLKDMRSAGRGLGTAAVTRAFTEQAREGLAIAESMGHIFRRDPEGDIKGKAVGTAGGHRTHRNVQSPAEGVSLGGMLHNVALGCGVDVLEEVLAFRLLGRERIAGLIAFRLRDGKFLALHAAAVVLATGGAGWLYYPHTDCTRASTGDGFALALEAGAELMGMEFMQFLPFAVTHPASFVGVYLGEPNAAGPEGRLLNGKGEIVMTGMHSKTRSQVSAAIALQMAAGNTTEHGGVTLDLSPNLETPEGREAWERFKNMGRLEPARLIYGQRAYSFEEPWDVAPTAHFSAGGIRIDEHCRSSLEGLYAAGEVSGGVHGADRLAGASLTETFLFGCKAGQAAAAYALSNRHPGPNASEAREEAARVSAWLEAGKRHRPITLTRRLQKLMWEQVGVARTQRGLTQALADLDALEEEEAKDLRIASGSVYNTEAYEALERKESRGGHIRLDFPDQDDVNWLKNLVVRKEGNALTLKANEVEAWQQN